MDAKVYTELSQLDEEINLYKLQEIINNKNSDEVLLDNKIAQKVYVEDTERTIWIIKDLETLGFNNNTGKKGTKFDENKTSIKSLSELSDVFLIDKTDDSLYYVLGDEVYNIQGNKAVKDYKYDVVNAELEEWETVNNSDGSVYLVKYLGNATDIVIPNFYDGKKVKGIKSRAVWRYPIFDNRTSIKSVKISEGVQVLGEGAFFQMKNIEKIEIPETVNSIGDSAFYQCSKLKSIDIPESVLTIGAGAFTSSGLKSITISKNVKTIGSNVFNICFIENISLDKENQNFIMENGILYNKEKTRIIRCLPSSEIQEFTISNDISVLDNNAFSNCKNLKSIYISNSIGKAIGQYTFYGCSNLNSVTIEEGITDIGIEAFFQNSSLKNIDLPSSLKALAYGCFKNSGLEAINLHDSVTIIGTQAFWGSALKSVYIENAENITIGGGAFGLLQESTIYVKSENIKNILTEAGAYDSAKTTIELY